MTKRYEGMLDALRTSVIEITIANPHDRDQLLAKSFSDYGDALGGALNEDLPLNASETDPVSLMADQLTQFEHTINQIESGACLKVAGASMPRAATMYLAKAFLDLGDMVVRQAAADFADLVEEGEAERHAGGLYKVASNYLGMEVLVKSDLPAETAAMISDPADILDNIAQIAVDLLAASGLTPREILAKRGRPEFLKNQDEDEEEGDEGPELDEDGNPIEGDEELDEDGNPIEQEPELDEDGNPIEGEGDEGYGDQGDETPLEAIGKLGSLILLQVDAMNQEMGDAGVNAGQGEGDDGSLSALQALAQHAALIVVQADALQAATDGEDEQDPNQQDPNMQPPQGQQPDTGGQAPPNFRKAAPDGDLAKAVSEIDQLKARLATAEAAAATAAAKAEEAVALAKSQPAPAKANLGGQAMTKQADTGGTPELSVDEQAEKLAKMSPEEQSIALMKIAQRHPLPVA